MLARNSVTQARNITQFKDFSRVATLSKMWDKFKFRNPDDLPTDQKPFKISRSDRKPQLYQKLILKPGCPRAILKENDDSFIGRSKTYFNMMVRNAFLRGLNLHNEKEEFLNSCQTVFFEVLYALREQDFSSLENYTLGGSKTLQFHRAQAYKLSEKQREALKITKDDLLGDNGYIMKDPYMRNEIGSYFHEAKYFHLDANDEPFLGDDGEPVVFVKYKVVLGGIYNYDAFLKEFEKGALMWDRRTRVPKSYQFTSPRYTFVELEICQKVTRNNSIIPQVDPSRLIYDFHVFSY